MPVPSQQRVRGDQRLELVQGFASECMGSPCESTTFGVGETDALAAQTLLQ